MGKLSRAPGAAVFAPGLAAKMWTASEHSVYLWLEDKECLQSIACLKMVKLSKVAKWYKDMNEYLNI